MSTRSSQEKRERQLSESDSVNSAKVMRPSGGHYTKLEDLEELVTCAIHLGMLTEPRVLPCGHAFCLACLNDLCRYGPGGKTTGPSASLVCPLCRQVCEVSWRGCADLPPSIAHNRVVEYVCEKKVNRSKRSRSESIQLQEDLLDRLGADIAEMPIRVDDDVSAQASYLDQIGNLRRRLREWRSWGQGQEESSAGPDPASPACHSPTVKLEQNPAYASDYELVDIETIRTNMKKFNSFKLHGDLLECPRGVCSADDLPQLSALVLLNSLDATLLLHHQHNQHQVLTVRLPQLAKGVSRFYPAFVRAYGEAVYISGDLERADAAGGPQRVALVLRCSADGRRIVHKSREYTSPAGGLCIDPHLNRVLLALPGEDRVVVLRAGDLEQTGPGSYTFEGLAPTYVARRADSGEIWVSSPSQGRLAVMEEETGQFQMSGREQIHGSLPTHLVCTADQRVIFLDSRQSRIFWVLRRNDRILVQRLQLSSSAVRDLTLSAIQAIPDNRLLLLAPGHICVVKPSRAMTEQSHHSKRCAIL